MKKRYVKLLYLLLCVIPCIVYGIGAAIDTPFPDTAKLNLVLTIKNDSSGTLKIKNESKENLKIQSLSNRLVLVFLLMDQHGNVIKPSGKAKVDPMATVFELPSKSSYTHSFKNLDFLSGTGLFEYSLEEGKFYRAVAVYRPAGPKGPGFCSNEYVFQYSKATRKPITTMQ